MQLETGLLVGAVGGQHTIDLAEPLLHPGITNTTELGFSAPDHFQNAQTATGIASGVSDLSVGWKQQLGPLHGADLAIIAQVSLPSGAHALTSHGYGATVQGPWSRKVSSAWTIAGMLSASWPTENDRRNLTGQASILADRQLTTPWDMFVEHSGNDPSHGGPQHVLHFGTAYNIGTHQQVDVRGGVGFASYPADTILGAGYSVRFDMKRPRP